jgi:hypothetical protein
MEWEPTFQLMEKQAMLERANCDKIVESGWGTW